MVAAFNFNKKIWVFIVYFCIIFENVAGASFGCTSANSPMTDDYRNTALQIQKQYRELMAKGKAPNKCGNLPKAQNYYEIQWDCGLETTANTWSANCQYAYSNDTIKKGAGEIVYMTSATSQADAVLKTFMRLINFVPTNGVDDTLSYNTANQDWNKFVSSKLLYVGCATTNCGSQYFTVCHYDKVTYSNEKLYTAGENCAADGDCNAILGSTCKNGLCVAPPKPDTTANTMCPTNPEMNDYAREQYIGWHNYYRSLVIKGNEPAGPDGARKAPKGKNMYKLKYSCQLEYNAQAWADKCPFGTLGHSNSSSRPGWGENMAWIPKGDLGEACGKSVQLYYSELPDYGLTDLVNNKFQPPADMSAGHYTQVVWGDTYEVGCGAKLCPDNYYHLVCQYNGAGNWNGEIVYDVVTSGDGGCKTNADCTTKAGDTCSTSDGLCVRA